MNQYNVAIIGGGPGGYVAAIRSAQLGLKTVLIEEFKVGGTCLNIGCIPTKTLVKNAEILHDLKRAKERGIEVSQPKVNMPKAVRMKDMVVNQLTGGVQFLLQKNGVTIINARARVVSDHALTAGGEEITFDNLIIATGSSNFIPPVPGMDDKDILTSTELLDIDHVPESLTIIGGGVIGCEFASIFNEFGCKVTIVEMMADIVPNMDRDISSALAFSMNQEGIAVKTGCKVTEVRKTGDSFDIIMEEGGEIKSVHSEEVLVSVGRKANTAGIESLELEYEKGYIKTDHHMRTSKEHIYAIGDVTGRIQLAHVASAQGVTAAENIAGKDSAMSYDLVPSCIFTIPEIGSVGMTEEQARKEGIQVIAKKFPYSACGKALAMGAPDGFVKIIADGETNKLLGCHIIGHTAAELISEAAAVMHFDGTVEDIDKTIHAHPTLSETVSEAALLALGRPIHTL